MFSYEELLSLIIVLVICAIYSIVIFMVSAVFTIKYITSKKNMNRMVKRFYEACRNNIDEIVGISSDMTKKIVDKE